MFIGREYELDCLENLYNSGKFEFLVLYGRRRVGKSELLTQFANSHKTLFFSAQEQSPALNLTAFLEKVKEYFNLDYTPQFNDWFEAIKFLNEKISTLDLKEKFVLIIDEFPFVAKDYPTIKSIIQHTIDHIWQHKNIMLVLCGSSVSFMINEVLGYSSPLYGRRTANIELKPLNYLDASKFLPNYSSEDKILAYSILGGIPQYLKTFNPNKTLKQNILDNIVKSTSSLADEVNLLLKQEFREPAIYNSILTAIACGYTKLNEISTKIGEENTKVIKYINELKEIKIIDRQYPYGEKENRKNSFYYISDNYFKFWFKYIFKLRYQNPLLPDEIVVEEILQDLPSSIGLIFERICEQYFYKIARLKQLPFYPNGIGKWWGNNPAKKSQDDVDILGINENKGIFCECKFRKEKFDLPEFNDLICASNIFTNITEKYYYIFVKSGYTQAVIDEAKKYNVKLLTIDDLFNID